MDDQTQAAEAAKRKAKLDEAQVPPYAYKNNLEGLGHPMLASIIRDRAYLDRGSLKSLTIVDRVGGQSLRVVEAVGRFAADLVVNGQKVHYTRQTALLRELKHEYVDRDERRDPVLSKLGKCFIAIPEVCTEDFVEQGLLSDFLLDHVAMGGGLILGFTQPSGGLNPGLGAEFDLFLSNSVTVYPITKPGNRSK